VFLPGLGPHLREDDDGLLGAARRRAGLSRPESLQGKRHPATSRCAGWRRCSSLSWERHRGIWGNLRHELDHKQVITLVIPLRSSFRQESQPRRAAGRPANLQRDSAMRYSPAVTICIQGTWRGSRPQKDTVTVSWEYGHGVAANAARSVRLRSERIDILCRTK
jgi:hypothetical protein